MVATAHTDTDIEAKKDKARVQEFIDAINDGKPLPEIPVYMIDFGGGPYPMRLGLGDLLAAVTCCIWDEKYGASLDDIDMPELLTRLEYTLDDLRDDLRDDPAPATELVPDEDPPT